MFVLWYEAIVVMVGFCGRECYKLAIRGLSAIETFFPIITDCDRLLFIKSAARSWKVGEKACRSDYLVPWEAEAPPHRWTSISWPYFRVIFHRRVGSGDNVERGQGERERSILFQWRKTTGALRDPDWKRPGTGEASPRFSPVVGA